MTVARTAVHVSTRKKSPSTATSATGRARTGNVPTCRTRGRHEQSYWQAIQDQGIDHITEHTASFDEMCWPRAGEACGDVEWRLRYHKDELFDLTREDELCAASILAAYRELVHCPRAKREAVVRRLRQVERLIAEEEGR